jgi:hypothetical protein
VSIRIGCLWLLLPATAINAGQPGKNASITDRLKSDVGSAPLAMQFKGESADDCRAWQK